MLLACVFLAPAVASAEKSLRLAVYALPPGLGNPYTGTGIPSIFTWPAFFEALTVMGPDGELQPQLATSWERLDPTTWRFLLREGVRFSNGVPFDGEAVRIALEYLKSDRGRTEAVARDLPTVREVRVVAPLVIDVLTTEPVPTLPELISVLRIPEPGEWQRLGPAAFARAPVGTGPFQVERWASARLQLVRNPHAWRPPHVDRIEIVELPDAASRVQGIQSGRVDLAVQLGPDDERPLAAGGARLIARPAGSILTLQFNTLRDSPLQDVRVRRALNLATNRQQIVDVLFRGRTVVPSQPAPRQAFGYDPALEPYPYDPAEARRLLAEAGWADGFALTAEVVVGSGANDALAYQSIAADLRAVGVELTLRTIPASVLIRNVFQGGWRGQLFGMDYGTQPTLDALRPFRLHSCLWANPWYCDETLVPVIRAARVELDPQRRLELTREVLRRTRDQASALYLYEVVSFDALGPRVRDYRNAFGVIDFAALDVVPTPPRRGAREARAGAST